MSAPVAGVSPFLFALLDAGVPSEAFSDVIAPLDVPFDDPCPSRSFFLKNFFLSPFERGLGARPLLVTGISTFLFFSFPVRIGVVPPPFLISSSFARGAALFSFPFLYRCPATPLFFRKRLNKKACFFLPPLWPPVPFFNTTPFIGLPLKCPAHCDPLLLEKFSLAFFPEPGLYSGHAIFFLHRRFLFSVRRGSFSDHSPLMGETPVRDIGTRDFHLSLFRLFFPHDGPRLPFPCGAFPFSTIYLPPLFEAPLLFGRGLLLKVQVPTLSNRGSPLWSAFSSLPPTWFYGFFRDRLFFHIL